MEEKIIRELMKECENWRERVIVKLFLKLGKAEKILVKVFVNICKYYEINDKEKILKYVKNVIKI